MPHHAQLRVVATLQEEGGPPSNGSASSAFVTSPMPKAASVAGDLPHLDLHVATCPVLEGASTQRLGPLERKSLASVLSGGSLQDMDSMPYPLQRLSNVAPSSQRGVLALQSGSLQGMALDISMCFAMQKYWYH